jgi:hypothetical protein
VRVPVDHDVVAVRGSEGLRVRGQDERVLLPPADGVERAQVVVEGRVEEALAVPEATGNAAPERGVRRPPQAGVPGVGLVAVRDVYAQARRAGQGAGPVGHCPGEARARVQEHGIVVAREENQARGWVGERGGEGRARGADLLQAAPRVGSGLPALEHVAREHDQAPQRVVRPNEAQERGVGRAPVVCRVAGEADVQVRDDEDGGVGRH